MRSYPITSAQALDTSASSTPVNFQSSRVNPPIYLQSVNQAVTATSASPAVFTGANTGLPNDTVVTLGGTAVPTGFTAGTEYYVVAAGVGGATKFKLSATKGGSAINSSSTGTAVTMQARNVNFAGQASYNHDGDEGTVPQSPFCVGYNAVLSLDSGAGQAGTVFTVEAADEDPASPGNPGSFTTLTDDNGDDVTITGVSVPIVFNVTLPQFLRATVTTAASEVGVGTVTLIGQ